MTSVVTPWRILLWALPSVTSGMSEWECVSMKPGATTRPFASMTRDARLAAAVAPAVSSTSVMRPAVTAMAPSRAADPVPSMMRALVTSTSMAGGGGAGWLQAATTHNEANAVARETARIDTGMRRLLRPTDYWKCARMASTRAGIEGSAGTIAGSTPSRRTASVAAGPTVATVVCASRSATCSSP